MQFPSWNFFKNGPTDKTHVAVVLGRKNVGKKTLASSFSSTSTDDFVPSVIPVHYTSIKGEFMSLKYLWQIWLVGLDFGISFDQYLRGKPRVILMLNVMDIQSFYDVENILEKYIDSKNQTCVIFANKADYQDGEYEVKEVQVHNLAKKYNIHSVFGSLKKPESTDVQVVFALLTGLFDRMSIGYETEIFRHDLMKMFDQSVV
eukprot:gb/GECH01006245.1/.p1 GENE.gb/GECH01006245.1/~~gb/GECH01006245.1/.p1  ORF type:complete len:203 (+),score=39.37 gb/GECH01006245.1/:1-609(+)